MNVGIIILAAGESKRMGVPKQLLDVNGKSMLQGVIDSALDTSCYPITVVVGAHKKDVVPSLEGIPINIMDNPEWEKGMSGSIKRGLVGSYLITKAIDAIIITTSDMPEIKAETFKELVKAAIEKDAGIITSKYAGVMGVPALIKRDLFNEILDLKGDEGLKQIFQKYKGQIESVAFEGGAIDIDTKEDYYSYLNSPN